MTTKLFVSYSWTSPEHEAWVVDLAAQLRDAGVDVILDKWDLREGHDANAFMEKMISDTDVKKVIMICDKAYAEKTKARKGGVGTEAQIISAEVYRASDQSKFVAIVKERDPDQHPYLPTYYASRIYIDLSDSTTYATNFEQLLRWIYDQPIYIKPPLGKKPAFLSEQSSGGRLGTSPLSKRAVDAIKNARDYADGALEEYLSTFSADIEAFRIKDAGGQFDDAVVANIEAFLPYRNEAAELLATVAQYRDTPTTRKSVHGLFERLIPYLDRPVDAKSWTEWDADNYRFLVHELYLYALAIYMRYERFDAAASLISTPFYIPPHMDHENVGMVSFQIFRDNLKSVDVRNERLELRRLSLRADMLKERCTNPTVTLAQLLQADFVLYLCSQLRRAPNQWMYWFPETLLYLGRRAAPFEMFVRARSQAYFENVRRLLGIQGKAELGSLLERIEANPRDIPTWQYDSIRPRALVGYDQLATLP